MYSGRTHQYDNPVRRTEGSSAFRVTNESLVLMGESRTCKAKASKIPFLNILAAILTEVHTTMVAIIHKLSHAEMSSIGHRKVTHQTPNIVVAWTTMLGKLFFILLFAFLFLPICLKHFGFRELCTGGILEIEQLYAGVNSVRYVEHSAAH